MKKFVILTLLISWSILGLAQCYDTLYVENLSQGEIFAKCENDDSFLGFIIYAEPNCENTWFYIYTSDFFEIDEHNVDSVIISKEMLYTDFFTSFNYQGCGTFLHCTFCLLPNDAVENPFESPIIWKQQNTSIVLNAIPGCYYLWSTGETTRTIEVTAPGTYSVTQSNECGSATYSVEVRDNVELYRATVDLRTNKNKVTWQVTPEQAEYITDVKVYRDDVLIGTTPYTNGYFLDAIGSDAAARNYRIVGVAIEGDDCPIPSYEKGTIHTTYYEDVDGNLNMTWNTPYIEEGAQGTLTGYQICKYNPATEEVTVVDQVNASITDYTCNTAAFTGGQATIAAIFDSKDVEDRAFSNLTDHTFAVCEENETNFMVYPNPSNGTFIVEGASNLTIYNTIGQIIAKSHNEEEKHSFSLGSGIYFIKSDEGAVKKIIVE